MIRLLLAFLFSSLSIASQAQSVIKGTILNDTEGIPGATIQIKGTDHGTTSDPNGYFELTDLVPGSHTLIIRSVGFLQITQTETLAPGQTKNLVLNMKPNELGLDAVVVTGTMSPKMVTVSPVKVEVVSSRYLNTFLPAASSTIMDGIKLINGVQEVVACGVCFTNSISINGLPGPYTAVLMDGSPIYGNLASVYGLNGIPNMMIDRLEVIKGPNSTLYGSEAMAGVINIITKNPESQPALSIDIMGTSHLETFGNVATAHHGKRFSSFTGLNYAVMGGYEDQNNDGFGDRVNLDRYSLFSKWSFNRPSGKQFTIAGKLLYEDRRNGVETFLANRSYRSLRGNDSIYGESIYTHRAEIFGTYELATKADLKLDYSLSLHRQDSYYGADRYVAQQDIGFFNFIWKKEAGKHALILGATNRLQRYDDNTMATRSNGENQPDNQWIPGIFIQDEWELSRDFTLLSGLRADHYTHHGLILSPRLSTKYKPGEWTTLRANFGTGFRVVNLFTEDHAFVTGQREVVIAETLNPERSVNFSTNFNHVFTLGSSQGMLDVDAYYSAFSNKIIPDYSQAGQIIYANSSGVALSRGVGFNWSQEFMMPFSFNAGFNYQSVVESNENEPGLRQVEFAPRWSGLLTANYQLKPLKLSIAYTMRITGPMALPEVHDLDENGLPLGTARAQTSQPFSIQNLQFTRSFGKQISGYAGIQNLFDYTQNESPLSGFNDPNAPTGFSPYFDTAYSYSPIHGREFYVGVKWDFP